ncbi:MAG: hypothetical protein ACYC2Y_00320 [Armatimonadota bacterium]
MTEKNVCYELCPETGIGSLILGEHRFDLMPDEAVELSNLVKAGDIEGARELLAGISPGSAEALQSIGIEELAGKVI